MKGFKQMAASR